MKTPLLSIITITHNNCAGLDETIRSCVPFLDNGAVQLVIVDGASTDATGACVARWSLAYPRDIIALSEPDEGIYDAMNKGLDRAQGGYVVFMNAGDRFSKSFVLNLAALKGGAVYYGDAEFRSDTGRYQRHYAIYGIVSFLNHNPFCHQATFYPRALLQQCGGYDRRYRVSADFDATLKCFLRAPCLPLHQVVCVCELGGFSHQNGWISYQDRMRSFSAQCAWHWSLLLVLYAPVFYVKHRVVKALDGTKLLAWYRSFRYG